MSQLGLTPVPISVNSSSGIGTNAKNLRGRSREIRDRMSASPATPRSYSSSCRKATIQAARRTRGKPSIILLKSASISVITLNHCVMLPTGSVNSFPGQPRRR